MSCPSRGGTISRHYELQLTTCLHSNHRAVEERGIAGFAIWKKESAAASAGLQTRERRRRQVLHLGACPVFWPVGDALAWLCISEVYGRYTAGVRQV
jgi:hypothetical protein